ncbi:phage holin family protein [Lacisediminimonas sp.]|uniref:phage holin family protein n=1 Tax=Lacisediminimonas sp. TaxID=3060582 RepID=UPI002723F130|nr:phage holin family protein [Lacisediminimonas sp.]MDO8300908.1 phage holin family protein [Lacisediminimonas sp.]
MQTQDEPGRQPGLFASATALARNALGLVISRIELAALEIGEIRVNVQKLILFGALGAIAAWFALAFWSMLIVVLAWPAMGWTILALLGLVFTVAAFVLFKQAQSILREHKLSLPATMAELRNDRDSLL